MSKQPSPESAKIEAEKAIVAYANNLQCNTPQDLEKILQLLISSTARAIEKYCGIDAAISACDRTKDYITSTPQNPTQTH